MKRYRNLFWMVGLTLVGFALRVYRLDAQSLWWDEIFGIAVSRFAFPEWIYLVLDDRGNPPGIYFLLSLWTNIGTDAYTTRFLSVLFGLLAIALIYRVAKLFGGAQTGLLAAGLLALSPHHLWYSQEARMYAPQIFSALASTFFFVRILRQPTRRDTLGYALASVAVLYLHYHPFFLLAQLVFLVVFRRDYSAALKYWLAAMLIAGILYAPWFIAVFTTGGLERAPMGWVPATQWYDPILTLYVFWLGAANDPRAPLNWVGFSAAFGIAAFGAWRIYRNPKSARERNEFFYLLTWLVVPILLVWAISLDLPIPQKRSAYVDRYLSPEFPAFLLLVAIGMRSLLERRMRRWAVAALAAFVPVFAALAALYYDPSFARDDWRDAAAMVRTQTNSARDFLILRQDQTLPLLYYGTGDIEKEIIPFDSKTPLGVLADAALAAHPERRVWIFSGMNPSNVHRFAPPPEQQRQNAKQDPLKQILDARLKIEREVILPGVFVTIYSPK